MPSVPGAILPALLTAAATFVSPHSADAAPTATATPAATGTALPSYADIADLADSAQQVIRAQVSKVAPVDTARASGAKAGVGRFYVEAKTKALIYGQGAVGESLRYLVDLPLDAKGKPPALKKKEVLLFARGGAGRPGEIQLVTPDAQILWDAATEQRLRGILGELHAADAPARVTGVREAIHVPGNLAGEGETQLFLATADGSAAAITLARASGGAPPRWSVSFSEVAMGDGTPPTRDTLEWYRLACFLPQQLPAGSNLSGGEAEQRQAEVDYRQVLTDLGPCTRMRK
jgi:hypothetical protein